MTPRTRAAGFAGLLALGVAGCSSAAGEETSAASTSGSTAAASFEQGTASSTSGATSTSGQLRYLFVQSAESARFRGAGDADTTVLELLDVSSVTFAFSEEPYRDTGVLPTRFFVETFAERFPGVSPNATVSSLDADVGEFPVALGAPTLSDGGDTVTYPVTPLSPEQALPEETGPVSVFIDPEAGMLPIVIEGTVVASGGFPLPGVTVTVSSGSGKGDTLATATTDKDGWYSMNDGFAWGTTYYMTASSDNFDPVSKTVSLTGWQNAIEFLMLYER